MHGINNKYAVIPLWYPQDKGGGGVSNIISLKNYNQAELYLMTGAVITASATVTIHQGVSVSSCATALAFTYFYQTGFMLKYDGASTSVPAAAGEILSAPGSGAGVVVEDRGGVLVCYGMDTPHAFVDNEVLTFSGGKTAVVDGVIYNEDIMVPTVLAAGVNQVVLELVHDVQKIYCFPVNGAMLNPGMDCIELNLSDPTGGIMAAFAILSEPRYIGLPPETAIYD
jgi:hypothetical protein